MFYLVVTLLNTFLGSGNFLELDETASPVNWLFTTLLKGLTVIFVSDWTFTFGIDEGFTGLTECKLLNNSKFFVLGTWLFDFKILLRFLFKLVFFLL